MPSVNLVWEQRATRQKHQQVAVVLLVCVGLALTVVAEEWGRTLLHGIRCDAKIAECERVIAQNEERARQNRELLARIGTMEPLVLLLEQAQRITLRWVYLMGELNTCIAQAGPAAFQQLTFAAPAPAPGEASPPSGVVGDLTLSGTAGGYAQVSQVMRRLEAQR
ncbi:MAG: hypothetical protein QHJ73_10025, partial [Armatimonadota bacterium]|nr:hypothetical protein [Armatimonadota bacterium]